ncbi:YczE/YyaS/YitT family protein [Alkalicoccus urumqiensis]|uniref:YitT family protein n=1 Tax=Alkalicoccus urumqiensis TaxID=1548213 RepID=A0A2P6MJQ2_ALKUR|nr:hypothetical protein [Alkalicoccus urumqiensis]PRO66501.1 hypothetical protein C6I21_03935 [Alkalicoccus urumqiensis]
MIYVYYAAGLLLSAAGASLTVRADLGASPFVAMLVGLSETIGLTPGSWEVVIAILLITINALLSRSRPEAAGIITALLMGIGLDSGLYVLQQFPEPAGMMQQTTAFAAGLLLLACGTAVYLTTRVAPVPDDRFILLIQQRADTTVFRSRTAVYIGFLVLALLLGGPIGAGTLVTVAFSGMLVHHFMPLAARAPAIQKSLP